MEEVRSKGWMCRGTKVGGWGGGGGGGEVREKAAGFNGVLGNY